MGIEDEEFVEGSYKLNYGPSKDMMFYVFAVYVSAMIIGVIYIIWRLRGYNRPELSFKQIMEREEKKRKLHGKGKKDEDNEEEKQVGTTRRRNVQSRNHESIKTNGFTNESDGEEYSEEEDVESEEEIKKPKEKIGTKKLRKLEEKEERRKMREEMEIERQERKERLEQREKLRQMEEERKREEEKRKEEEERIAKEKKEQEEHELYLELKKQFEINEEGQDEVENEDALANKLEEFVSYIRDKKVVLLEDLASRFGLRTQDAIDRVQDLLKNETISGVIDDRGKFIYISQKELEEVANFVTRRGRVAISEIAAASNKLINITPTNSVAEPTVQ